jgi:hypothetical protein
MFHPESCVSLPAASGRFRSVQPSSSAFHPGDYRMNGTKCSGWDEFTRNEMMAKPRGNKMIHKIPF